MAETGIVSTGGIEMEYFKFGSGNRIFTIIPGLSIKSVIGVKEAVEEGFGFMKEDFTFYVFDRKKDIPQGYTVYDMADDTAAVMKELGLRDTYMFGASQGGMIAMAIAVRYPELVKKLALGSTSAHVKPEQSQVIEKWIELAGAGKKEELYQEFGRQIYPPAVYEQFRDYFSQEAKTVTDKDLERFIICAKAAKDYDLSSKLDKIDCPTLALGAFEDSVLDSDATMEIAEKLDHRPDFALYMYTGYGHAAFDTAPDYRQRVYDFFMKEAKDPGQ